MSVIQEKARTASTAMAASEMQRPQSYLDNRCAWYRGTIERRRESAVKVGPDKMEVVASFCYLDDMLPLAKAVS